MHIDEAIVAQVRERYGSPVVLMWDGEISDVEWMIATHNPTRTHDVTLFILDASERLALIRKPHFAAGVWRPARRGVQPREGLCPRARPEAPQGSCRHTQVPAPLVSAQ